MSSPHAKKKPGNAPKETTVQDAKLCKKIELLEIANEDLNCELRISPPIY